MTRFDTATGDGKYSLSFETDNHEHYEYMQRAARFCIDGHFFGANLNHQQLQEELTKAKNELEQAQELNRLLEANCERFSQVNYRMNEQNEALRKKLEHVDAPWKDTIHSMQGEILQLRAEVAKAKKQAEDRKLLFNIAMALLDEAGVNMDRFLYVVARERVEMDKDVRP